MAKRGASGLSLVVGIDKPEGMTSHDVVNRVRRIFGERRVGHTGTLDPLATGALIVCIGPATRLDAYFTEHSKRYVARIAFGAATDTDDRMGQVIAEAPVPAELQDMQAATETVNRFVGDIMQVPPQYSAIKRDGVKAYEAARRGAAIEIEARPATVHEAMVLQTGLTESGALFWDVAFTVSKGTYIRSLARDIGEAAGTHAHIHALRRISTGGLDVSRCVTLEQLDTLKESAAVDPVALLGFPCAQVTERQAADVRNGKRLRTSDVAISGNCEFGENVSVATEHGLMAIYNLEKSGVLKPSCVFSQEVTRGNYR